MRYIKQDGPECFLAAICQVVPSMNIEIERKFYRTEGGYVTLTSGENWLKTAVPEIYPKVMAIFWNRKTTSIDLSSRDIAGKGILLLQDYLFETRHAISYEGGLVLDSGHTGEEESLEAFMERTDWNYYVEGIIPIDRN